MKIIRGLFVFFLLMMVQSAQAVSCATVVASQLSWYTTLSCASSTEASAACTRVGGGLGISGWTCSLSASSYTLAYLSYGMYFGFPAQPTCVSPQVLDTATNTCVAPTVCTAPQYLNTQNNTCVTPPTCTAPQYLDNTTHACATPPTCTAPQVLDNTTHSCVTSSACAQAGTLHSKGFFNVGTLPTGKLLNNACVNSCNITLKNGVVPAAKSLINGVYYYFGQAEYSHVGTACTPDTPNFLSDFVGNLPGQTCGAGQQMISMNGVTKCFDSAGSEVDPNSQAAKDAAKAATDTKTAQAIADAEAAIAAAGGTATDGMQAKIVAAGVAAAGGTGSFSQNPTDPVQSTFCAENPKAPICLGTQAKAAGALPGNTNGSWYVKTYPDGIQGVLTTNFNTMKTTPLFGLIDNIVPTISGTAHNGCFTFSIWKIGNQELCLSPLTLNFIGLCMILTALFSARSIIFGG